MGDDLRHIARNGLLSSSQFLDCISDWYIILGIVFFEHTVYQHVLGATNSIVYSLVFNHGTEADHSLFFVVVELSFSMSQR